MAVRVIALSLLIGVSLAAFADTLTGKVVKITDDDTLYVLDANYKEHKISLAGIDAPERKQAYGLASRKHLASKATRFTMSCKPVSGFLPSCNAASPSSKKFRTASSFPSLSRASSSIQKPRPGGATRDSAATSRFAPPPLLGGTARVYCAADGLY